MAATSSLGFKKKLFATSLRFYQTQKYKPAEKILLKLTSIDPKNGLYWFNLGNTQFMLKNYLGAETAFLKVENLSSPLAPAAAFYRAKALRELNRPDQANALLQSLLQSDSLPQGLRKAVASELLDAQVQNQDSGFRQKVMELYRAGKYRAALSALRDANEPDLLSMKALVLIKLNREELAYTYLKQAQARGRSEALADINESLMDRIREAYSKSKWLFLEASAGSDSNLSRLRDADPGQRLALDLGGGARIWNGKDLYMANLGYLGRLREAVDNKNLRVFTNELFLNFGRELGADLIMISPFFKTDTWASQAVRQALGSRLLLRTGSEEVEYGFNADFSRDRATHANYEYLEGTSAQAKIFLGRIAFPYYIQGFLILERQDVGDQISSVGESIPMSYAGYGLGTRVLSRLGKRWSIEGLVSYVHRDYEGRTSLGEQSREDKNLNLGLTLWRRFYSDLSIYTSTMLDHNQSTLDKNDETDQNYQSWQWMIGGLWEAF